MSNPFAAPASASGIQWKDLTGRLLVIEPKSVETGIATTFGDTDAVKADVYVIDGDYQEYIDTLIFPRVLQSQTRSKIGEKVLGRLGQGQAKSGQSAPWMIQPATEQDIANGTAWLEAQKTQQFTTPDTGAGAPPF